MNAAIAHSPVPKSDHLGRIFAEHYRRVLLASYRVLGNLADAEDVAQGVFLGLSEAEMPAMTNAGSYLYRAAVNGSLDLLRRRSRAAWEPLDAAEGVVCTGHNASPEAEAAASELVRRLRLALAELAPRAAEMFALRYLEEFSNREIARLMNTSQAVVAVTLYQARAKLKKRLNEPKWGTR